MRPGEYRAASLGSLFVILALGAWAAIWGPDSTGDESPAESVTTTLTPEQGISTELGAQRAPTALSRRAARLRAPSTGD